MKAWLAMVFLACFAALPGFANPQAGEVPRYDVAKEVTLKGVVTEVVDRTCAVSGGMGAHLMLKLGDGSSIEVHLAPTKFVKSYELVFSKGDQVEVIGSKVNFENRETVFARQVTRGADSFVFRDEKGKPVW